MYNHTNLKGHFTLTGLIGLRLTGGYAQPSQYVQVLAALLNDGKSPKNGAEILKPETVKLMWENQIPEHPDFAREGLTPAKAEMSNAAPEIYPQEGKLTDQLL